MTLEMALDLRSTVGAQNGRGVIAKRGTNAQNSSVG